MFPFPNLSTARVTFKAFWLAIAAGAFIAVAVLAGVQTARLHGFHVWPISVTGWIKTAELREGERDAERKAHTKTKTDYREAQAEAARLEAKRIARVEARQQEEFDAQIADYRHRLAGVHAHAERLRAELLRAGGGAAGAGAGIAVPGVSPSPGRAAEAAGDPGFPAAALCPWGRTPAEQLERDVTATEQALQLDALISAWRAQAAIDPNAAIEAGPAQ